MCRFVAISYRNMGTFKIFRSTQLSPTVTHSVSILSTLIFYFDACLHLSDRQVTLVFLLLIYSPTVFQASALPRLMI